MALFFVGGSQRSGTTLLQTILCQDKRVNPLIQEPKYFRRLIAAYKFGKESFKSETRDYFKDFPDYTAFNARIARSFVRHARSLFPEAAHLVLREPHLTMLFPELAELLPTARFICIVRDPRDAVASMIEVGERLDRLSVNEDVMARLFRSRDAIAISRHYLSFYTPVLKCREPAFRRRLLFLRYEDLVKNPAPVLETLRKFTGIPLADYDPDQKPDTGRVDYSKLDPYRKAWATRENLNKVTSARIGAHAGTLSDDEIRKITEHCERFMRRFNYA